MNKKGTIYVDTKTKNNENYLLKNNLNNFRANQLPGATRKTTHSVNWYINPNKNTKIFVYIKYNYYLCSEFNPLYHAIPISH